MKAETLLDSVVFQLTPTRTRYDLVIIANGKTEKIVSGLLDPFLAHLKAAKDQIAKGGYSIRLEPDAGTDTTWFTKDTVERFVRYVSTPEVLERASTLESEILQINEAIAIQGNGRLCSSNVEDHRSRWAGSMKGSRSAHNSDMEKAIILSKHGKYRRLSIGSTTQEDNSRRQLLKVLEGRKTVLRKEQGMAFARAVAAGFGMDHMENLILFAKSFGASRLLEACLRFADLWKAKHKNGQLLELVCAEAVPFQSEFTSMKASGIIVSGDDWKERQFTETWPDNLGTESNEKDDHTTASKIEDKRLSSDPRALWAPEYRHGQIQNPMLLQWASHGPPVSQSYPVQNMSYYQSYPVSFSAFQSPYPPTDDPVLSSKMGLERHSSDTVSKVGIYQNDREFEKRTCQGRESRKKAGHSGKRRSPVVVAQKKHITSEGSSESRSKSRSASDAESEEEIQDVRSDAPSRKHRKSSTSVNNNGSNVSEKDQVVDGQEGDTGNWQTFQKLLLKVQRESTSAVDRDMFSIEEPQVRRRVNKSQADPSISPARNNGDAQELRMVGCDIEGGGSGYCRAKNDDFMISGPMKQVNSERSSNPMSEKEHQNASNFQKSSFYNASDESFIVPLRSDELVRDNKAFMDVNSDFHSATKNNDYSSRTQNQHSYEPHDLRIMPKRGLEKRSSGLDPAKDFDMQIPVQNSIKKEGRSQDDVSKRAREVLKGSGKERKSVSAQHGLEKRKMDSVTMKGKSSKLNPLADAKARAEKLRAFKADLRKAKKEKEEEERRRLEALKMERQKRIAARSSLNIAQSLPNAPQTKAKKPTRHYPSSCNGSKFRDPTPTSLSPLRKMPSSSKSPLTPQQIGASVTPKPSPFSYKGSKFSDAQPATSSPLLKLLRSSKNIAQSTSKQQETTVQKQTRPSPPPIKKLLTGSKSVAQSTTNPLETAAQKPTGLYSSSGKGSKFSDTAASSSSPLQKLPARTTSTSSLDSHKITKLTRINGSAHLVRNGSRQSASPVSRLKKEINQAKRVSDPEGSKLHSASSGRSLGSDQVQKKPISKEFQGKSKLSTLSTRIGTLRQPCGEVKKNPGMKGTMEKSGGKTSLTSEITPAKKGNEVAMTISNNEDDPIVEKAVLILENKKIPAPVVRPSEVMVDIIVRSWEGARRDRIELASEHPTIQVPSIPLSATEVDNASECKPDAQPSSYKVVNPPTDASQKFSNFITNGPNQSFARALYTGESTASNTEHIKEHVDQKVAMVGSERIQRACKSMDLISVEQIHEMHEKPHGRGSSKGFKELLKLRRKGQSSASIELNADTSAINVCTVATSSNNGPRLKDLFSKDSHAGSTPPKASRPFSLFSPFQNKSSEKKAGTFGHT